MQRLRQLTFASLEHDRKTRREIFLERMDGPILWTRLEARIAPTCPKGGCKGRQPHPLPVMLRVHCVWLRHGSLSGSGEKRAAACAASGLLGPDDYPAAPVMTGEKRVRNLPDRPCGG